MSALLKAGKTEEQVLQQFVKDVGGIHVLSEPPDKGFNRLAWAVPYAVGLGSFAAFGLVAYRWSRRRTPMSLQARGMKAEARSRPAWTRNCVTSTSTRRQPYPASASTTPGLHVGPFFLIVALTVSIVAFLLLRGQPLAALTLVALTLIGAGLTAAAMYRTIAPLGSELRR